jgi:archaellum component FlaC
LKPEEEVKDMAENVSNELLYEVMKSVQAQVAMIREDVNSIKARLTSLDSRLSAVHTDMALQSDRLDRLESHINRVDTRLKLTHAE